MNGDKNYKKTEKYVANGFNQGGNFNTDSEVQLTKKKVARPVVVESEESEEEVVVKKSKKKQKVVEESD
jgi:hypothetical protein